MMQRLGAEMAGFSGGAGSIWEIGCSEISGFSAKELSRYICHVAGDSFVSVFLT